MLDDPLSSLMTAAASRYQRLAPAAACREWADGAFLVDVRPGGERLLDGDIPGAIAVERTKLEWRVHPASPFRDPRVTGPDPRVILICTEGFSTVLATATLLDLGMSRVTDVIGGFAAWRDAGLPVGTRSRDGVGA